MSQDPQDLKRAKGTKPGGPGAPSPKPRKSSKAKPPVAGAAPAKASGGPPSEADPAAAATKAPPPPTKGMSQKELAAQYMPYVRSIAGNIWKTLSKDIEFDDLVGYGMIGLFEAADRFDAKFGANFMTFAYYRIRGAIYDGLRGMGWVSRTEYQKVRFEQRANNYLNSVHDREMQPVGGEKRTTDDEEVGELADVVGSLVTIYVTALDAMEGFQIKDDRGPAIDESLEMLQARALVREAVGKLPEQERKLLELYYYKEQSLEEVGKVLGLSKSWTSRLHARAIDKLSRLLKDLVEEHHDATGGAPPKAAGKRPAQPSGTATR